MLYETTTVASIQMRHFDRPCLEEWRGKRLVFICYIQSDCTEKQYNFIHLLTHRLFFI